MSAGRAPMAILTPISPTRRLTAWATTAYNPPTASNNATAASTPNMAAFVCPNWCLRASDSATGSGPNPGGRSGSRAASSRRNRVTKSAGDPTTLVSTQAL